MLASLGFSELLYKAEPKQASNLEVCRHRHPNRSISYSFYCRQYIPHLKQTILRSHKICFNMFSAHQSQGRTALYVCWHANVRCPQPDGGQCFHRCPFPLSSPPLQQTGCSCSTPEVTQQSVKNDRNQCWEKYFTGKRWYSLAWCASSIQVHTDITIHCLNSKRFCFTS